MLIQDIQKLKWNDVTAEEMHPYIHAVVVPENFDPNSGWQHIWQDEEERKHFIALSEDYKHFSAEWFKVCGIERYPGFAKITYSEYNIKHPSDCKLFNECKCNAANIWKNEVIVHSFEVPFSIFSNLTSARQPQLQLADALMEFLKTISFKNKIYAFYKAQFFEKGLQDKGIYKNRGENNIYADNTVLHILKKIKWIPSKHDFFAPTDVFLSTDQNQRIFCDTVPYIEDGIDKSILKLLGVCVEPTVEKMIEILEQNSSENRPACFEKIYCIYEQLKTETHI